MRTTILSLCILCMLSSSLFAQTDKTATLESLVPYSTLAKQIPGLTFEQYKSAIREVAGHPSVTPQRSLSNGPGYLGNLSANQNDPNSVSNPYGAYGSTVAPNGINNPYSNSGSLYSPQSVANPNATNPPIIVGQDGQYLGRLSTNKYGPESVSNPYGVYGSQYSPTSVNNPYSKYGSEYSPLSATNPFATKPPVIIQEKSKW
ncbi:MAG: hypothetical protein IPH09_09855 [bacterium]|nr:hypothetical protein [bacterium]